MSGRRRLFEMGALSSHDLGVPVLSVGNLTVGGTGKSPMIDALLSRFSERGVRAMVLSRGYGAQVKSDGVVLNDEGHMMRRRHPGHAQVQGTDRVAAARAFLQENTIDIILLDDGAQHLRVRRDGEILMFDGEELVSNRRVLPAGPWRESLRAAQAASCAVVTGERAEEGAAILRGIGVRGVQIGTRSPMQTVALDGSQPMALDATMGTRVGLVSAIGRPDSFERTSRAAGFDVVWSLPFADHDALGPATMETIAAQLAADPVDCLLTTSKDAVKLASTPFEWRVLEMELELSDGWSAIDDLCDQVLPQ